MADGLESPFGFWRRWCDVALWCNDCDSTVDQRMLAGFDWRDLEALTLVRRQYPTIECSVCGAGMGSPVPLVQHRPTDSVRVLVALPSVRPASTESVKGCLDDLVDDNGLIIGPLSTVPASLAVRLFDRYTGLLLVGLDPSGDEELASWVAAVRGQGDLPDVVETLAAFVSNNDLELATASLVDGIEALDDRWRIVRRRVAARWSAEVDGDDLGVLQTRLRHLDQWVLFNGVPPDDQSGLSADVVSAVDAAIAVDPLDDTGLRRDRLLAALRVLEDGPSPTLLIGTLSSAVAALISLPSRTSADLDLAVALADRLVDVATRHLGSQHRLVRRARNDRFVALLDGLSADDVAISADTVSYELFCALATRVPVMEHG